MMIWFYVTRRKRGTTFTFCLIRYYSGLTIHLQRYIWHTLFLNLRLSIQRLQLSDGFSLPLTPVLDAFFFRLIFLTLFFGPIYPLLQISNSYFVSNWSPPADFWSEWLMIPLLFAIDFFDMEYLLFLYSTLLYPSLHFLASQSPIFVLT